jgi:uncharacterized protein YbjT (DUF2867 family)
MEAYADRFCHDLPTQPVPAYKILVTGATGYIGSELVPELVARGYQVRVMVRSFSPEHKMRWPGVEIIIANALKYADLKKALEGIHCAYYFMHSLNLGKKKFKEVDNQVAINFRKAAEENNLKRIIYLGGLGDPKTSLSDHLRSRLMVAKELQRGKTPVTFLRAAVIIGSGSTSYKIIKHLVQNCPVFLFPRRANSSCQPIGIRDVIKYLVGCLENDETTGKTFDIGGQNILTYQKMLMIQANVIGKKRFFIPSSFSTINVYARIASLLTPVPYKLIKTLMESCFNDVVCQNTEIKKLIPFQPLMYKEALIKALSRESQRSVSCDKQNMPFKVSNRKYPSVKLSPPIKSKGIFSDIRCFMLHKPEIPTLIKFNSESERQNYSYRILQRLHIGVSKYKILNIHKIGINAPAKYVFEELLKWNGDSSCWPNYIAKVSQKNNRLENLSIYLFGWMKYPFWLKNGLFGLNFIPLFKLNAINFQKTPDPMAPDNARYLLYKSSGGYPIGVFAMYVRSSIANQQEEEQSQLFLMVGFNFYGKENWSKRKIINRTWELTHDRVTSNVLNRVKQLSEWRFEKIQNG